MESRGLLIGGREVAAADHRITDDVDPYTGETVASVAAASPSDAVRAVDAAAAALPEWSRMTPSERRHILWNAADLLERRASELADWVTSETGALRAAGGGVHLASRFLREAAAVVTSRLGEVLPSDSAGTFSFSLRQPAGVVLGMAPWNAPIGLGVRALAIPLAVGNTVVLKPSEDSPITSALLLADVLSEAGVPPGVVNVVTNAREDAGAVVEALIADPRVRRVNFTGSTKTGRRVGELAGRYLKPAILELGGKNSIIVRHDADLAYAARAATFGSYANAGQICMCSDRLIVHESVADAFLDLLCARASALKAGDPRDPATRLGPLISAQAARRVADLVHSASNKGAKVLLGGGEPEGSLYPATVLAGVTPEMEIYQQEVFGPTCAVLTYADDEEAIAVANDTPYGLSAGVITEDLLSGLSIAKRLETGMVHINDQSINDEPQAPFGGMKDSGFGRFGGLAAVDAFTELRWVTFQETKRQFH